MTILWAGKAGSGPDLKNIPASSASFFYYKFTNIHRKRPHLSVIITHLKKQPIFTVFIPLFSTKLRSNNCLKRADILIVWLFLRLESINDPGMTNAQSK